MRLIFITGSLQRGGAERHAVSLMNGLAKRGHECTAVYIKSVGGTIADLGLDCAVAAHVLGASRYLDLRAINDLAALIAQAAPDLIVATNPYALMYATLARTGRIPLVTTFHSTRPHGIKERLQMLAYRPLFWNADCTIFVSAAQREVWRRRGLFSRRSEVIHNGIDAEREFAPNDAAGTERRGELGLAAGDYVIGICGWLRPEKNHVQLVEAVARLRAAGLPAHALLIGDGETREVVTARARELGIGDHVTITGARQDVRSDLAACDVLVLCSVAETFSLAALEAMALERPVVHVELGGAREMIIEGLNGFLFPVRDTAALVQRLEALAEPGLARRLGRNARVVVREAFTSTGMVDRYESLFRDLRRPQAEPGKPLVLLLGPDLGAVSGVSTHLNMLRRSSLADRFALRHFQVGREGRRGSRAGILLRRLLGPLALAAAIGRRRPVVVHINTSLVARAFWRDLAHLVVARLAGARVVYQVHGGALPQQFAGTSRAMRAILERALRLPDCIIVLARSELAAYAAMLPGQDIRVIPNAVEAAVAEQLEREPRATDAPLRIVYLGRLVPDKGLHELLRGLAEARSGATNAELTLAGSGPEEARLRALAAELGLGDRVRFAPPVFGVEKQQLLAHSDVLALPTYHEGLPYALLEAMNAGLAVITTRVGAIPDVATEGVHGLFVPLRDPGAIAAAIARLAQEPELLHRMARASRERIAEAYLLPRLASQLADLYAGLCANPPPRRARRRSSRQTVS